MSCLTLKDSDHTTNDCAQVTFILAKYCIKADISLSLPKLQNKQILKGVSHSWSRNEINNEVIYQLKLLRYDSELCDY